MKFLKTFLFLFILGLFLVPQVVEAEGESWVYCNVDDTEIMGVCYDYKTNQDYCANDKLSKTFNTRGECEDNRDLAEDIKQGPALAPIKGGRDAVTSKIIPECALENGRLTEECKDISIFLYFAINIGRYLFTIVGSLTLAVFVYGGFMLILSQGNPEKVKKGTDALVGAVIGLIVVFSAYMLVKFMGESIGLDTDLQLAKTTIIKIFISRYV